MAASTVAIGEALRVLFLPTSSSDDRKRADRILNEFQRTPEAWQLADELLRAAQPDQQWTQHCRMFAAQTMRIKLQRDYKQLPAGSHLRLIEALVAHLKNLHNAPGPLVTQLCLAIASLAVNLFGTQWKDPIKDLVGTFTASAETLGILLTLIAVLPEECTNQRLLVTAAQRSAFIKYLEDSMPYVLQLLLAYLQRSGANSEEHLKIFRTLASWMRFGWGSIGAAAIATNPLLVAPFQALSSPPLFSVAVDLIVELINQTVNVQEQLPVIRAVLPQVIGLLPLFQKAVNDEDEEVAHGLCVIFSEAADIWIPLIAQLDKEALPLLDLLLACISHPDWEVGQCGLRFWKHLLRSTAQLLGEAEKSQNPQLRQIAQQKLEPFRPYFAKLFDSLRQIVRFPPEWHEWPADQQDEFKDYRAKVGDVLKLLCETLGDTTVLTRVYQLLSQQLQAYAANPDPVRGWQDIEASLYTVRSIGRHVSHTESVVLPELMKLLPQLPQQQHLHYTALLVVGRYAEWLHHHPAYLLPLLNYITAGLRSKEIASASALAFKYVCEVCAHHLVAVLPQIFEMFGGLLPPVLDWAPDLAEVVEGLARIVSVLQDPQDVQRYASQLIAPFAAKLQAILASQTRDVLNIRNNLEAIGVAFSHIRLNKSAALVPVVQQLWPLFSAFFVQYVDEASVQEKVTKCLKCIIRCLVTDFRPLLKEVTALCLQCFATRQHACYVFLSSEIVVTFSHNASPEELQLLIHLYRTVSSITLPLLTSQEQSPSVDIPDLVEEYFYFGSACARIAHALLGEAQLAGALQAAVRCLSVPHREALKGVLSFLQRWCELASPVQKMPPPPAVMQYAQRWLGETGNSLCRGIVQASIGPITAYCIPELALLIQTMLKASAPHTLQWMTDVLASFPPEILAPEEKAGILQGIQNGVQDGQAISVALDRLEELCDVLRRADEA